VNTGGQRHRLSAAAGARAAGRAWLCVALLGCLMLAGCAPSADEDEVQGTPEVRAKALIEQGNQAFRTGDYRLAAKRYAAAAETRKDDAAAYYGMGMALSKLGRDEDARKAYARARELNEAEKKGAKKGS
jgi:Tfp pilus assembly protein PilF